jgi:hypothetical protein
MKTTVFALMMGITLAFGIRAASAEVNCEQVRRYLKTGRSVEDVSETMIIDVKDVKKCQEAGGAATAAPTPAAPKEKQ